MIKKTKKMTSSGAYIFSTNKEQLKWYKKNLLNLYYLSPDGNL